MKGRVLKFEELKVGMKVCDEEGNPLIIMDIKMVGLKQFTVKLFKLFFLIKQ